MARTEHTSIEELVARAARGLLYGHPHAWGVPGGDHPAVAARRTVRRRSLRAILATRADARAAAPVSVEAGGCG